MVSGRRFIVAVARAATVSARGRANAPRSRYLAPSSETRARAAARPPVLATCKLPTCRLLGSLGLTSTGRAFYDQVAADTGLRLKNASIGCEWTRAKMLDTMRAKLLHTVNRDSMRVQTMPAPLTDRQAEVLGFVQARRRAGGIPPTLDEICTHFGFSSANAAREHLRLIQKKGYLQRDFGKPRAIRVARSASRRETDVVRVPLLGRIPAGEPCSAVEEVEEILPLPRGQFRGEKLFALRVRGESMVGAGILDGDVAVLDADREPADGSIAAVVLDDEATLKRLYRSKGGLRLVAENPAFLDRNIPRARLPSVRVAGVFVGLIRTR